MSCPAATGPAPWPPWPPGPTTSWSGPWSGSGIEASFGTGLAGRLTGPDARLRAELLAALVTGVTVLHDKIGTPAITAADRDTLAAYVELMAAPLLADDPL